MSAEAAMGELAAAGGAWGSQDRLEWLTGSEFSGEEQPRHITARRANGLWVVKKCGVYRTLDALFDKQREMVEARDIDIDKDVIALRFGLELRRRTYTWRRVPDFDGFDDE